MKKFGFSYRRRMEEELADKLNNELQAELDSEMTEEELFSFADFDAKNAERGGYSNYSYWGSTLRAFFQNKAGNISIFTKILIRFPHKQNNSPPLTRQGV